MSTRLVVTVFYGVKIPDDLRAAAITAHWGDGTDDLQNQYDLEFFTAEELEDIYVIDRYSFHKPDAETVAPLTFPQMFQTQQRIHSFLGDLGITLDATPQWYLAYVSC